MPARRMERRRRGGKASTMLSGETAATNSGLQLEKRNGETKHDEEKRRSRG